MTIAFDASSTGYQGYGGTVSSSHTGGSGANRVLIVGVNTTTQSDKVSGITYGGVAMTRIRAEVGTGVGEATYLYKLVNPASGVNSIVCTFTTSDVAAVLIAVSFSGVDQTTPTDYDTGGTNQFGTSPRSMAITVSAGGVGISLLGTPDLDAYTVGGAATQIAQLDNTGTAKAAMSYLADATAMSWTWAAPANRVLSNSLVALKAAVSAPATGITTTGPSSGTTGVASTNFSVGVTPVGGTITGTVVVTPSDAANGGTFTPTTVSLTTGSPTATFTYTPASVGAKTISNTNNGSLTNPSNITYTSNAPGGLKLFRVNPSAALSGLGSGGPFFQNPLQ